MLIDILNKILDKSFTMYTEEEQGKIKGIIDNLKKEKSEIIKISNDLQKDTYGMENPEDLNSISSNNDGTELTDKMQIVEMGSVLPFLAGIVAFAGGKNTRRFIKKIKNGKNKKTKRNR